MAGMLGWVPSQRTRLAVVNDINLYSNDVMTFAPGCWLNDNAITFAMEVILSELPPDRREKVHVVQPSMVELLKMSTDCDVLSVCFDGVDLSKKDLILFVLNDNSDASKVLGGTHWTLLAFSRLKNSFIYLDSLGHCDAGALYWARQIVSLMVTSELLKTRNVGFEVGKCAKQKNSSDCGMFVVEFARLLLMYGEALLDNLDPGDILSCRETWIATVYDMYTSSK